MEVGVGEFSCDIETVDDTQIVCEIANVGKVHSITNQGTHRGTSQTGIQEKNNFSITTMDQLFKTHNVIS